jgi:hypothetical protein
VAATFKLKYSLDGGLSWNSIPGAKGITGTSFDWIVPELAKNNAKCLMQLTAYDANGLKLGTDIQWTTYTTAVETVKLFYTLDASAVPVKWNLIQTFSGGSDPGIHTWPIPTVTKIKTKCMVKVVLKDVSGNNVAVDVSDSTFTIRPSLP